MYKYVISPVDGQGKSTGTNRLEKAIMMAARKAAKTMKVWEIWWDGAILMHCNEYAEQIINKIRFNVKKADILSIDYMNNLDNIVLMANIARYLGMKPEIHD